MGGDENLIRLTEVRGPKSFAQHALGIFAQFGEPCLRLAESKENSSVDEEKGQEIKMNDSVDLSLASERIDQFVEL